MPTKEELLSISVFEDLDETALKWLQQHMDVLELAPGDPLTKPGDAADWLFVLFTGRIRFESRQDNGSLAVFVAEAGEVSGMLPHSRMTVFQAGSVAVLPSRIGRLHVQHFPDLLTSIPVLEGRLAHIMLDRTRASTQAQVQQEKLAGLGTMAAGLAHELNNPASAAKRAAHQLCETLQQFDELASSMLRTVMFKEPEQEGDPFQPVYEIILSEPPQLDTLTAGEREDELADWLENQGISDAWNAAATLTGTGFTRDFLVEFSKKLRDGQTPAFLKWLAHDVALRELSQNLALSTTRISDIVQAMKAYSYMDKANEKTEVDIHEGINNTLTILNYKVRQDAVTVVRDFGDLPRIQAYGGELNQVWTNLIDNALGAVPDQGGRISISTRYEPALSRIHVEITDNGPGIPEAIQHRIFDPFFTTKEPGEGTGLGLNISHRIVTNRHEGSLTVDSKPGQTSFQVRLPTGDE